MVERIAAELNEVVEATAARLRDLEPAKARARIEPTKWSIQEILGHLIDSAANNHQRFVRAQEASPLIFPKYEQDHWVDVQSYRELPWRDILDLWRLYNRHLAQVIAHIPGEKLSTQIQIADDEPVSLEYLVADYVVHLKHHLGQIDERLRAYG